MHKNALLLHAAVTTAIALSACSTGGTVDVPLEYAKLSNGYVNSDNIELGNVFVWDKKNQLFFDEKVLRLPPDAAQTGHTVASQQADLSTSTDFVASADMQKFKDNGTLQAAVSHSTTARLENFNRVTIDALNWVNLDNDLTRAWRQTLANRYPGDGYEFFVVDRVILGNKISLKSTAAASAGAGANIVQIATNVKVSVTYGSQNVFEQSAPAGGSIPLLVQGSLLRLKPSASGPTFVQASGPEINAFNFQAAMKHE